MRRKLMGLGMILLILISLYPLAQHRQHYWLGSMPANDPSQPDFIIYHSVTHHYGALGQLKNTLFSEKTAYFKQDHHTRMIHPYLLGYQAKALYWRITADQGDSWQNEDKITLQGHVTIYQPSTRERPATTITTQSLTYYLKRAVATTQDAVLIEQNQSRFSAVGMTFYLKTGTLVAHAQSRGRYALN